jgi:hypothetical protein
LSNIEGKDVAPDLEFGYEGIVLNHISTMQLPDNNSNIKLEKLACMLDADLNGTGEWDVTGLVLEIFSDDTMGMKVSKFLLSHNALLISAVS